VYCQESERIGLLAISMPPASKFGRDKKNLRWGLFDAHHPCVNWWWNRTIWGYHILGARSDAGMGLKNQTKASKTAFSSQGLSRQVPDFLQDANKNKTFDGFLRSAGKVFGLPAAAAAMGRLTGPQRFAR
jgi:hypothetical protein